MDVKIPEVPPEYDSYREEVRSFIAAKRPHFEGKQRAGARVLESERDVAEMRRWIRDFYDSGYRLDRYEPETDEDRPDAHPFKSRIIGEELARAGVATGLGNGLVAGALRRFGNEEQRRKYLPPLERGDHIWTQLFSEPNAGSDLASLQTRARREGDHYVVDGQKVWSTYAHIADYGYLLARTDPDEERHGGISAFIFDLKSPGVEARPLREMTGTSDFCEVFMNSVEVPAENVIGEPGQGWQITTFSLANERGGLGGAGGRGDPIRELVELARSERRGGQPAIEDPTLRQQIGRLCASSRILRNLGYAIQTRALRGESTRSDAPLSKIFFSELNLATAECGLALQGARSLLVEGEPLSVDDGRWQDMFLYARAYTIAGGSNEILRNMIAERGLELPREPRG